MAKIDILLPYWGDVDLFKQAVLSVLAQSESDWNLLIFDDHYPSDEAELFIASINDKRITYTRHEKNIGITANFNFAVSQASSPYCVIMGCDDILLPAYVEAALENVGDADMYQPGVDVIDANSKVYLPLGDRIKRILQPRRSGLYSGESLAASLCTGNWLYFPSILWKTATLKKHTFNEKFKILEDVIVELDILKDGGTLYFDKSITFQYRRFPESLSSKEKSKHGVRFGEEAEVYEQFAATFRGIGWKKAARAAHWRITSRLHQLLS